MRIEWLLLAAACAPDRPSRTDPIDPAPTESPPSELTEIGSVDVAHDVDAWIYGGVDNAIIEVPRLGRTAFAFEPREGSVALWVQVERTGPEGTWWDWLGFDALSAGPNDLTAATAEITGFLPVIGVDLPGAHEVMPAGDVDGDGEPDVLLFHGAGVALASGPLEGSRVSVANAPLVVDLPTDPASVTSVDQDRAGLRDLDHDGVAELVITHLGANGFEVLGFYAPFSSVRTAADADFTWTIPSPEPPDPWWLGLPSALGDVTGDGVSDWYVPVGVGQSLSPEGGVVLDGGVRWAGTIDVATQRVAVLYGYPGVPVPVGDQDRDGHDDLVVVASGAVVFASGAALTGVVPLEEWIAEPLAWVEGDSFGEATAALGDVNGDGFDDVLVGTIDHGNEALRGGISGPVDLEDARLWRYSGLLSPGALPGFLEAGGGIDVVQAVDGGLAIDWDADGTFP